jgi:hypothetical protein
MAYPTVEKWDVVRAAYKVLTFGARGQWIVRAAYSDCIEAEDAAIRRGRSFRTRREARAWIATRKALADAEGGAS